MKKIELLRKVFSHFDFFTKVMLYDIGICIAGGILNKFTKFFDEQPINFLFCSIIVLFSIGGASILYRAIVHIVNNIIHSIKQAKADMENK